MTDGSKGLYHPTRQIETGDDHLFVNSLRNQIVTDQASQEKARRSSIAGRLPRIELPANLRIPRISPKWTAAAVAVLALVIVGFVALPRLDVLGKQTARAPISPAAKAQIKKGTTAFSSDVKKVTGEVSDKVSAVVDKVKPGDTHDDRGAGRRSRQRAAGTTDEQKALEGKQVKGISSRTSAKTDHKATPGGTVQSTPKSTARPDARQQAAAGTKSSARSGSAVPRKAPRPIAGERKVVEGDYLRNIARRYYGNEMLWPLIWDYNRARAGQSGQKMVDPDLIYPGWTFVIPAAGKR